MILATCTHTDNEGYVVITELTDGKQYLPEGSSLTAKNRFAYNETASIDIFRLNHVKGETYSPYVITDRQNPEEARIKLTKDGWFTAIHIVIPTKEWVYKELDKQGSIIHTYDVAYFTDGSEIYTCVNGSIHRTTLTTLLNETRENTTISRVDTDYVSIDLLVEQQKEAYRKLFENRMYNGGCETDACEANRLTAAINLTKHYVRWGQLAEAERVIEKTNYFQGTTLHNNNKDIHKHNGCGCL